MCLRYTTALYRAVLICIFYKNSSSACVRTAGRGSGFHAQHGVQKVRSPDPDRIVSQFGSRARNSPLAQSLLYHPGPSLHCWRSFFSAGGCRWRRPDFFCVDPSRIFRCPGCAAGSAPEDFWSCSTTIVVVQYFDTSTPARYTGLNRLVWPGKTPSSCGTNDWGTHSCLSWGTHS